MTMACHLNAASDAFDAVFDEGAPTVERSEDVTTITLQVQLHHIARSSSPTLAQVRSVQRRIDALLNPAGFRRVYNVDVLAVSRRPEV